MSTGSHMIGSLETWEPEDKSFSKHIIRDGYGDVTATDGSVCIVCVTPIEEYGIDQVDLGSYQLKGDVEITVGEGDTILSELLDNVIMSMKEGECCYIKTKIGASGKIEEFPYESKSLKFNVSLKSLSRAADTDLQPDEIFDRAQHHKMIGVQLYQQNKTDFSIKRFQKALRYLQSITILPSDNAAFLSQIQTLTCQCHLNLAANYLRTHQYPSVIEQCFCALKLDPANVKGLYRRGLAFKEQHMFDEARRDLLEAKLIEPENKTIASELRVIDSLISKEKKMYQRMFTS